MGFEALDIPLGKKQEQPARNIGRNVLVGNEYLSSPPGDLSEPNGYRLNGVDGSYFYITDKMLSMGLMLLGSTGCGKTNVFNALLDQIIPCLSHDDIMIILDSKGDFKQRYFDPDNPDHILFSLKESDRDISHPWNIYGELSNENGEYTNSSIQLNSWEISQALFKGTESSMQPFFTIGPTDILSKLLCVTAQSALSGINLNTSYLNDILGSDIHRMLAITDKNPEYRYLRAYVGNGSSNQALGMWGNLMAVKARVISPLCHNSNVSDFNINDFVRNKGGRILFLEYDIRHSKALEVLFSLIYDIAIKEALSTQGGNKYFICDEANLLPYVENIEKLVNYGRSYGCKTIFGLQSYAQLKKNYSEAAAESLSAGFCSLFAFQNADYLSRDYVKRRIGETFEAYSYGGTNITHDSFTVTDAQLRNLNVGEAFVDIKNQPVFKFRFSKTV